MTVLGTLIREVDKVGYVTDMYFVQLQLFPYERNQFKLCVAIFLKKNQATGTLKIGSYSGQLMKGQIYSGGKLSMYYLLVSRPNYADITKK